MWRTSYIALSSVLGIPVAEAEGAVFGGLDGESRAFALSLRAPDQKQRAMALARPLAAMARAVDAARIA